MGVIGILTCEILELEFAHLLSRDPAVKCATIVEDAHSTRLLEALDAAESPRVSRIAHVKGFSPTFSEAGQVEVLVRVLEFALHRKRELLQQALIRAAHELQPYVDVLLLGYGLCGNALLRPLEVLDVDIPVFQPLDNGHPVDDCVGLLLGGRECYYAEQQRVAGTFFMLPGWTHHWQAMFGPDFCADPEMARRMLARYERALLVQTPVMSEEVMRRQITEFIRFFELRIETCQGTLRLLRDAWNSAKAQLAEKGG